MGAKRGSGTAKTFGLPFGIPGKVTPPNDGAGLARRVTKIRTGSLSAKATKAPRPRRVK